MINKRTAEEMIMKNVRDHGFAPMAKTSFCHEYFSENQECDECLSYYSCKILTTVIGLHSLRSVLLKELGRESDLSKQLNKHVLSVVDNVLGNDYYRQLSVYNF